MSLYALSAIVLILGAVLTVMVFLSYRKRLAGLNEQTQLDVELLQVIFQSTPAERTLGYAMVAAIAYLIWQTIQQGFDFALLMIGATAFTGVVWLIDRQLTKKKRLSIIDRAEQEIADFEEQTDKSTLEPGLIENSRAFFPILVFVFLLRSFLVEPFQIPSGSMKPTLEIRDFILVNRFTYGIRMPITNDVIIPISQPERGDVIVFKPPHEPDKNFIKRVIAVPGDLIEYDYAKERLKINGELITGDFVERVNEEGVIFNLLEETIGERSYTTYQQVSVPLGSRSNGFEPLRVKVPEGKYFAMGDNRDNSADSRYWGFVDENAILGEAFVIWMHWEGFYPSFSRAGKIQQ